MEQLLYKIIDLLKIISSGIPVGQFTLTLS